MSDTNRFPLLWPGLPLLGVVAAGWIVSGPLGAGVATATIATALLLRRAVPGRALAAGLLLLGAGLAVAVVWLRSDLEPLTADALEEARRRWAATAPSDYTLRIEVSGAQTGHHVVEVRGGRVVRMTTGDVEVDERIRRQWSVEGLFEFAATELRRAATLDGVELSAQFHPEFGYPRHFLRHVLGEAASIEWEVTSFEAGP